jgi:hypothetical protein
VVPAPTLPARVGSPLEHGSARVGLEANALDLASDWVLPDYSPSGEQGDPGVFVPDLHLGASGYLGLSRVVEMGIQARYTRSAWADRNFADVIEFPDDASDALWSGGGGLRLNFDIARDFTLSGLAELNLTSVPEVEFCHVDECSGPPSASEYYVVESSDSTLFLLPNVGVLLAARVAPWISLIGIAGAQMSTTNVGFDTIDTLGDDTDSAYWLGYAGAGADLRFSMLYAGAYLYVPFAGEEAIDFGLRADLLVGIHFGR